MDEKNATELSRGLAGLRDGLASGAPIVGILGQNVGWTSRREDSVVKLALAHAGRDGTGWSDLLARDALPSDFYLWLTERFSRRSPSEDMISVADMPLSAIFTSSIDPGLSNLFRTNGREPDPILLGNSVPTVLRSVRRPPIFYLFGRSGTGADLDPPATRAALPQRRMHASAMLRNIQESATALGLIVIDGYSPADDWLRAEDLLAVISGAPSGGVIWFGEEPAFSGDEADTYADLIANGTVVREESSLGTAYAFLKAAGEANALQSWDEPELLSLQGTDDFVVSPKLRLFTEATTSIVDNSWTGYLPPFTPELEAAAFHNFHGANVGPKALVEGIRRGYAITRTFETDLYATVERALRQHHAQEGAIILHGQSGVGKTIALGRLATRAREEKKVAVLFASGPRMPQPADVAPFLEAIDNTKTVTLLLIDANGSVKRYDDLLSALRSGGNRVVIVGTTYRTEDDAARFVEAPAKLDGADQDKLVALADRFASESSSRVSARLEDPHALARFYWSLPESRGGISEGLSREARTVETAIRVRASKPRPSEGLGAIGLQLVAAGYAEPAESFFPDGEVSELDLQSPAAKVIDYVMAVSRLHRAVPVNLLLRTVLSNSGRVMDGVDVEVIRDLFEGQDLFRWHLGGRDRSELLIGSRLQIEAELVCNRRLGTPEHEAARVLDLISNAYRAGPEDSEESHFVADIVYAMGPDGPARDRYKTSYLDLGRALSTLRERNGVLNARLMLQESTLRRSYVKHNEVESETKAVVLEEATRAVDDALTAIELTGSRRLYAARRTRENLYTERAATYGYLATDSAQRDEDAAAIWAGYRAARDAARKAAGRVFSYQPLDIALWAPIRVLKASNRLDEIQRAEMRADIRSTLDFVDPTSLEADQAVLFNKQKLAAGDVLNDDQLSDEAFAALESMGSAAGFYHRARNLAPTRPEEGDTASAEDIEAASHTVAYLSGVFPKISQDARTLQLLVFMQWLTSTGRWLFRGLRQPLPHTAEARQHLHWLVSELKAADEDSFSPQFRYLDAVLSWLSNEEKAALQSWRTLARDTEYVEARRVANRHTITDASGSPVRFDGVVVKALGSGRWSVRVPELDREVDLIEGDFSDVDIAPGRTVPNFAISFSYRGPIADNFYRRNR
ncbi:MAG: hypothetical protein EOP20_00035 [Hyphomicrobiales bacterium]|nr:MAG: hypothetical protein EOP20_00035 [Hyphomicrobiales bacterium]